MDAFLVSRSPAGTAATLSDFWYECQGIDILEKELGLRRQGGKEFWTGSQRLGQLRIEVDSVWLNFQ